MLMLINKRIVRIALTNQFNWYGSYNILSFNDYNMKLNLIKIKIY